MASPDTEQSGSDVVDEVSGLPRGGHAPMSIGQMGDTASGQPELADGVSAVDADPTETREWLDSLRYVINSRGGDRAAYLLHAIEQEAYRLGVAIPFSATTPYINTIPVDRQPPFPGNRSPTCENDRGEFYYCGAGIGGGRPHWLPVSSSLVRFALLCSASSLPASPVHC